MCKSCGELGLSAAAHADQNCASHRCIGYQRIQSFVLVALDEAVVCHYLWAAAEHYRLVRDSRPIFEKLDDFALAFVNVVEADVHRLLKLGDLICQSGKTA